jgi:predicted DNA-binding antitoxin AbrB/MazE fold protein
MRFFSTFGFSILKPKRSVSIEEGNSYKILGRIANSMMALIFGRMISRITFTSSKTEINFTNQAVKHEKFRVSRNSYEQFIQIGGRFF